MLLDFASGRSLRDDVRWLQLLQWTASVSAVTPSLFCKFMPPWKKLDGVKIGTTALPGAGSLHHQICPQKGVPCQTSPHTVTKGTETHEHIQPTSSKLTGGSIHIAKKGTFSEKPVMAKMFEQCKVDRAARQSFDTFLQEELLMLDWLAFTMTSFYHLHDCINNEAQICSYRHTLPIPKQGRIYQTRPSAFGIIFFGKGNESSRCGLISWPFWYEAIAWHNNLMPWQVNSGMTIQCVIRGFHVLLHEWVNISYCSAGSLQSIEDSFCVRW